MNNTSLLERCLTPVSIELRHAIYFLENETLDEAQKKLAQYEVDNLKSIKADLEAAIAEQKDPISHYARGFTDAMHRAEQAKPQEPVAYRLQNPDIDGKFIGQYCYYDLVELKSIPDVLEPLYTRPQAREPMGEDAKRYQWLKTRLLGADFDWNGEGKCVIVFDWPKDVGIGGNCDMNIDAAIEAHHGIK